MKLIAIILILMLAALNVSAQEELYVVCEDSAATLKVYFGKNPDSLMNLYSADFKKHIKKIVFDESVKDYRPTDCSGWFEGCDSLTDIIGLEYINTENVTNMSRMFFGCNMLKSVNLRNFNTEKVVDMSYMFANDRHSYVFALETLDLSSFDTRNVVDMTGMFNESEFKTIYVSEKWTTQNVKYSNRMFHYSGVCGGKGTHYNYRNEDASYARIDGGEKNPGYFTSVEYKKAIEKHFAVLMDSTLTLYYDVPKPDNAEIYYLGNFGEIERKVAYVVFDESFKNCSPLSCAGWFNDFYNLLAIKGMQNLNTNNCVNMKKMFASCAHLKTLDLSGFNTSNVENMHSMFYVCSNLRTIYVGDGWSTKSVIDSEYMFGYCDMICGEKGTRLGNIDAEFEDAKFARIDGGKECPGYFTKIGTTPFSPKAYAVLEDSTLTLYYDVQKPQKGNVFFVGEYLGNEHKIKKVCFDKSFKNYYPKSCAHWFDGLKNLKEIYGMREYLNTQYVVYMDYMFSGCERLETIDLSSFDTRKTRYMGALLRGCTSLKSVNLKSFNTSNVYDMSMMFNGCKSLDTLDLSSFNTTKVLYTNFMFYNCFNLKTIFVGDGWRIDPRKEETNMYMLSGCYSLRGGQGYSKGNRYAGPELAHIDGGAKNPGLLSRKGQSYVQDEYAILKDSTLIFYYGKDKPNDMEIFIPGHYNNYKKIKHVIFDESFKHFAPISCSGWFKDCDSLVDIKGLENLNTKNVVDMSSMFEYCKSLKTLDLSTFDTHNVTNMDMMFYACTNLKTVYVGDNWNTEYVKDANYMFYYCYDITGGKGSRCWSYDFYSSFKYAHIDEGENNPGVFTRSGQEPYKYIPTYYNTKDVETDKKATAYRMFEDGVMTYYYGIKPDEIEDYLPWTWWERIKMTKKVVIDSSFINYYPKNCEEWFSHFENMTEIIGINKYLNTDSVTDFSRMFYNCSSLREIDLSRFKTNNVKKICGMFGNCLKLTTIYVSGDWVLDSIDCNCDNDYYNSDIFDCCFSLVGGNGTTFNPTKTNSEYARIDGGMSTPGYFTLKSAGKCKNEPHAILKGSTLTLYYGKKTKKSLNINGTCPPEWKDNASKIEKVVFDKSFARYRPIACNEWFAMCSNLKEIIGIENLNTENVTDMTGMFFNCSKLRNVDVSGFKTSNVVSMNSMFYGCTNLENVDLSGFDTRNVTNMAFMFYGCEKIEILDCGCFNTGNVKDMNSMFKNCNNLKTLNLKSFNTSKTSSMAHLFSGCKSLKNIDLSSFDFSYNDNLKFRNLAGMFEDCIGLEMLDLSKHNVWGHITGMFFGCINLNDLKLFSLDTCKNMAGLFYGCKSLSTIDLCGFKVSDCPENVSYMFAECENLETIYVSDNWEVRYNYLVEVENLQGEVELHHIKGKHNFANMFKNCPNLTGGIGTKWDEKNVSNEQYLRIDGGSKNPGYFTKK